jgi:methylmalonyl-CoA/ethylmalonyl-CoA epimerase
VATPLTAVGQIAIPTRDVQRAISFYRDTLGLEFLFQAGTLAFFMCGDVRLLVSEPESDEFASHSSVVYFRVADIHAARAELARRGVRFEDEPHMIARMPDHALWMTFFRDPDDNLHALMSEVREPPSGEDDG